MFLEQTRKFISCKLSYIVVIFQSQISSNDPGASCIRVIDEMIVIQDGLCIVSRDHSQDIEGGRKSKTDFSKPHHCL